MPDTAHEFAPTLSPNGAWVAYGSSEGGTGLEVYVTRFPELRDKKIMALLTSKWVEVQVGATRSYAIWAVTA